MKEYRRQSITEHIFNEGYEQEGYESILAYKIWLALHKVSLTKPRHIRESLDAKKLSSLEELKNFVMRCEEQGLDDLEIDSECEDYTIESFDIICSRTVHEKKTEQELKYEYTRYVNAVIEKNRNIWLKYKENVEKEKKELAHYLLLKAKYEGKNDK